MLEWFSSPGHLRADHQRRLEEVRKLHPLDAIEGPLDAYNAMQVIALATPVAYEPRPVIQSYAAFDARLAGYNRDHLLGPDAPRSILFSVIPIDDRYPSLEDGLSWPLLLTRYQIERRTGKDLLLLTREESPRSEQLVPLSTQTARLGERIEVPPVAPGAGVWAEVDVTPSAAGQLLGLVFKRPALFLETFEPARASPRRVRVVPGMGNAGFLLSPMVLTSDDFERFSWTTAGPFWEARTLEAFRLGTFDELGAAWAYDEGVEVRFFAWTFERRSADELPDGRWRDRAKSRR